MRVRRYIKIEGCLAHYIEERIIKTIKAEDMGKIVESRARASEIMPFGTISVKYNPDTESKVYVVLREPSLLQIQFVSIERRWLLLLPIHLFRIEFLRGELYNVQDFFMIKWPQKGDEVIFRVPFPNRYSQDGNLCRDGLFVPTSKDYTTVGSVDMLIEQILAIQHNFELIEAAISHMPMEFRRADYLAGMAEEERGLMYRTSLDNWEAWTQQVYEGTDISNPPNVLLECSKITWSPHDELSTIL